MYAVPADLGALSAMVRRGFEKLSQIRHEQTRAGVGRRGNAANAIVVVEIHLPPNIDEALAENIDPALARVVEEVVGMFDRCGRGDDLAGLGVEDDQACRHPAANEEPVVSLVEGHREIRRTRRYWPTSQHRSLCQIGDFHFLAVRDIDEDAGSDLLELEGFGMGVHVNVSNLLPVGIEDGERTASARPCYFAGQEFLAPIAHDDVLASVVIADIVGVQVEGDRLQKKIRGAVKNLHGTVAATGDEQPIGGRIVVRSLGLVQTRNRMHLPACLQIEHFERVIVERRREEALAFQIDPKMIHAAFDVR